MGGSEGILVGFNEIWGVRRDLGGLIRGFGGGFIPTWPKEPFPMRESIS